MLLRNFCDFPDVADGATPAIGSSGYPWDTPWDVQNNAPTKKKSNALFGEACMHCSLSASALCYGGWDLQAAGHSMVGWDTHELWFGQYLYCSARVNAATIRSIQLLGLGGGQVLGLSQSTAGVLAVRNTSAGAVTAMNNALPLGRYMLIEGHVRVTNTSTGAFTTDVQITDPVNGKIFDSISGVANTIAGVAGGFGGIWFGCMNTSSTTFAAGFDIDACYVHNNPEVGWLGLYPSEAIGMVASP